MADGHLNKCKDCTILDVNKNSARVGTKYDFSEKGVIRVLYKTQKKHQKGRGHGKLPYSKEEFTKWLYSSGYKEMYDAWILSGNNKDLKPSVDRVDSLRGYSFDNMELVTWAINRERQAEDIRSGEGSSGKRCTPVQKIDAEGNVPNTFVSMAEATRIVGYRVDVWVYNRKCDPFGFYWSKV